MVAALVVDAHPLVEAVAALEAALDRMPSAGYEGLDETTVLSLSARLAKVSARVTAQQSFAARVIDERNLARRHGATSTADLLGASVGHDRAAGRRLLGAALAAPAGTARELAFARGDLTDRQTRIIDAGLQALPSVATQDDRQRAENLLIKAAAHLPPRELQARADRIAEVFAPEPVVDALEDAALASRELAARERSAFAMWDNGDGTHSGRFTLPDVEAAMLRAAVDGYSSPRRQSIVNPSTSSEQQPQQRLGLGFAELVGRLPATPQHGGSSATVLVTMRLEDLTTRLAKAARCSDGTRLSAAQARKLACTAGVIPVVLDGDSMPLDLGRSQRLFSPAQRTALAIRDEGCSYPGCDRPPGWTEAHHFEPWAAGGPTDLVSGGLVCFFHHHHIHQQNIVGRLNASNRKPEYRVDGAWLQHQRFRT